MKDPNDNGDLKYKFSDFNKPRNSQTIFRSSSKQKHEQDPGEQRVAHRLEITRRSNYSKLIDKYISEAGNPSQYENDYANLTKHYNNLIGS